MGTKEPVLRLPLVLVFASVKPTKSSRVPVHMSKLLRVYLEENHSIQSLHDATGISNSTIWTSMKKTKQYVNK